MSSDSIRLRSLASAVGAAAEAASLDELGRTAFSKLAAALDACPGILFAVRRERLAPVAVAGEARTLFPRYMERISGDDPLFHVSASIAAAVHIPLHHADQRAFRAARAYDEFYRPNDIAHKLYIRFAGARLAAPGALSMGLTRGRRLPDFGPRDLALAARALPAFQAAARRIAMAEQAAAFEVVEALAERGAPSGLLALDRSGRVLWFSSGAAALLGPWSLPDALISAARRLAALVDGSGLDGGLPELRLHFELPGGVAADAELSIARTASGEPMIAVGFEQTAPPRARVIIAARRYSLTPTEADTLALLAQGLSNAAIGSRLRVELSTVKTHVHRVIQKLGVTSRVQAALLAHKPATETYRRS